MNLLDPALISSWHCHVYFDAERRDAAWALRGRIETALAGRVELGRFHERPVGPHPVWSYQLAVQPPAFAEVLAWLALNRAGLDVFVHPNTDDSLRDHRDGAIWLGRTYPLNLQALQD